VVVQAFGSDIEYGVLHLTSGNRSDGWWAGRMRFRRWLGNGPHLLVVQLLNRAGRYREVGTEELAATGRPSTVQVRSRTDDSRPRIGAAQVTPSTVDATTGDSQAVIRLHLTDTGSGVRTARVGMTNEVTGRPRVVPLHLQSGTRRDGLWEGVFKARSCSTEAGDYNGNAEIEDLADNGRVGSRNVSLSVVNLDRVAPRIAQLSPPTGLTDPVTITFTEDVVGLSAASAPVRPLRGENPVDVDPLPAHPGTWSCRSGTAVEVDCVAGRVRIAQWTPSTPLTAGTSYVIDVNPEFVLDVLDLAGNPVQEMSRPFVGPRLPG
jgi:hypothetical protein